MTYSPAQDTLPGPTASDEQPRYRSAAVARMVRMPVATLRIWERRYQVAAPATTPSGHRLYSAQDVRRLGLLRQLTELGHAIGTLASMDMAELHEVATTHASAITQQMNDLPALRAATASAQVPAPVPPTFNAWHVAAVGQGLLHRLAEPTLASRLGMAVVLCATGDVLADLSPAAAPGQASTPPAHTLIWQTAGLYASDLPLLMQAAQGVGARRSAVLYAYASASVCAQFEAAGVALLRWPQPDASWLIWLRQQAPTPATAARPLATAYAASSTPDGQATDVVPPRRYDDATLTELAGLSSTMVCECPQHVAELLMLLTQFEAYSAECAHRSAADALLHQHLQSVAARSRALFEDALERVVEHEGLVLPRRSTAQR